MKKEIWWAYYLPYLFCFSDFPTFFVLLVTNFWGWHSNPSPPFPLNVLCNNRFDYKGDGKNANDIFSVTIYNIYHM